MIRKIPKQLVFSQRYVMSCCMFEIAQQVSKKHFISSSLALEVVESGAKIYNIIGLEFCFHNLSYSLPMQCHDIIKRRKRTSRKSFRS